MVKTSSTAGEAAGLVAAVGAMASGAGASGVGFCGGCGAVKIEAEGASGWVPPGETSGQVGDAHESELTCEGQRLIAALLLGEPCDPMLAGVIDAYSTALLDRKAARAWKTSVSQIILRADGSPIAEIRGPRDRRRSQILPQTNHPAAPLWLCD